MRETYPCCKHCHHVYGALVGLVPAPHEVPCNYCQAPTAVVQLVLF